MTPYIKTVTIQLFSHFLRIKSVIIVLGVISGNDKSTSDKAILKSILRVLGFNY